MRHRIKSIHFIGIGGSGMSGIAEVLNNLDYEISGSDMHDSPTLQRLASLGIKTYVGHTADNVKHADAIVVSSAIPTHNVELNAARQAGLPIVPRASMLNELLRLRQGIAVAGSHGKTTITSMIASVLQEADLDPTYVVGGLVKHFGNNAALGKGEFIVVESDESDGSFLRLSPVIAVASNIDSDHLQTYDQDLRKLKRAFIDFFENLPFYGVAILCSDDKQLSDVGALISRRVITYSIYQPNTDFHAHDIRVGKDNTTFRLEAPYGSEELKLGAIGAHNVSNALAALAVAHEVNVDPKTAHLALEKFAGVGRRLETYGEVTIGGKKVLLIDDYGHHPTEIEVTLEAVRSAYPQKRIVLVFQPHRYSRTRDQFNQLALVLASADALILTDVYSAGEEVIPGATGTDLMNAIKKLDSKDVVFVEKLEDVPAQISKLIQDDDLVLTMGAGSISSIPKQLVGTNKEAKGD